MPERLTKPAPYDGSTAWGGVGVIPRRQQDPVLSGLADAARQMGLAQFAGGMTDCGAGELAAQYNPAYSVLSYLSETAPLRLLRTLTTQDGTAQMASTVEAALAYGAGKVRFVAIKNWRGGKGVIDDAGTSEINRVLSLYQASETRSQTDMADLLAPGAILAPSAIPAALPLLLHATDRINDTGQVLFEATGEPRQGVTGIYDAESLDCRYRDAQSNRTDARHTTTGGIKQKTFRVFEQIDKDAKEDSSIGQVAGWRIIDGPGIVSVAWKGSTNNPYGVPRNGASLAYLLRKVARRRDLADWLHNSAFPKIIIEQLISKLYELLKDNPRLLQTKNGPVTAEVWMAQQQQALRDTLQSTMTGAFWMIGEGKAYTINPSNIAGLQGALEMDRIEEIQALNMLPALLGVTDGGTQAYAEVQWLAQVQGLGLLSAYASAAPIHIGNLHFRLLGEDLVVQAKFDDLPPLDPQKTAQARTIIAALQEHLAAIGVNSPEYFAQQMSGSGAVDLPRLITYLQQKLASDLAGGPQPTPAAA